MKDQRYICHCEDQNIPFLGKIYDSQQDVIILIGPEGDFTMEEIQQAKELGFKETNLGSDRLRVETAGVAACIITQTVKNLQ